MATTATSLHIPADWLNAQLLSLGLEPAGLEQYGNQLICVSPGFYVLPDRPCHPGQVVYCVPEGTTVENRPDMTELYGQILRAAIAVEFGLSQAEVATLVEIWPTQGIINIRDIRA